jgi:8-oxo-dGTP diphosphatase
LLVREGGVLLGRRSVDRAHFPNVWDLFGGHAEHDESPDDALIRELQEEIGVTPTSMSLLEVAQYSGPVESYEYRIYVITAWDGTPANRQPEEHAEIRWVSSEQLNNMPLAHPAYLDLIHRALGRTSFPPSHPKQRIERKPSY